MERILERTSPLSVYEKLSMSRGLTSVYKESAGQVQQGEQVGAPGRGKVRGGPTPGPLL